MTKDKVYFKDWCSQSAESPQLVLWPESQPPIQSTTDKTCRTLCNLVRSKLTYTEEQKLKYLNKHYLPTGWKSEGLEEFPINNPYLGPIPDDVVGIGHQHSGYHPQLALHNFTYDYINERIWTHLEQYIRISSHYGAVFGLDFSPLVNGRRCEVVEAIRRNRTFTAALQARGVNVIQSAAFGHPKHNSFVFDGLACNAPVAIEHMQTSKDKKLRKYYRKGVEDLIEKKNPSILLVVGFPLDFDVPVAIKYYKCHIQKLRELCK